MIRSVMYVFVLFIAADRVLLGGWSEAADGYALVISEDFDTAVSLENFQFSDPKAWRWSELGKSSGALELHQQASTRRSTVRRSILRYGQRKRCGDFIMEVDMKQSGKEYGHRDMCLYFNFVSPTKFYYTHLATTPDPNAHNIFIVNEAPANLSRLSPPKASIGAATGNTCGWNAKARIFACSLSTWKSLF